MLPQLQQIFPDRRIRVEDARSPPMQAILHLFAMCSPVGVENNASNRRCSKQKATSLGKQPLSRPYTRPSTRG
jgi:hypothetical protein